MPRPRKYDEVEVYRAIHEFRAVNGIGPTNQELARMTGNTLKMIPSLLRILEDAGLIERTPYMLRSVRIKGHYKVIKAEDRASVLADGRKRRALRDRQTYESRAAAARKGLMGRKAKRMSEDARIELAVQMANANEHEVIGVDFVHDYRNRHNGAFHARRLG